MSDAARLQGCGRTRVDHVDRIAWMEAPKGYLIGLINDSVVCKNPQGKILKSVPKWLREDPVADKLLALTRWLAGHRRECFQSVENWMTSGFAIPLSVVREVWDDPDWQSALSNLFVVSADNNGVIDHSRSGFLRAVLPSNRIEVLSQSNQDTTIDSECITIPHPVRLPALNELRSFLQQNDLDQNIEQLNRAIYSLTDFNPSNRFINDFAEGMFQSRSHFESICRRLNYTTRVCQAVCRCYEDGDSMEARFMISEDPSSEIVFSDNLFFVDAQQHMLRLDAVKPVTFSEGIRMASRLFEHRIDQEVDHE